MPNHINFNEKNVTRPIVDINEITSIHFGKDVESIDAKAFMGFTNLETVTFDPECKITSIQKGTFENCTNLKYITLPDGLKTIGCNAFCSCKNLESVTLPDSVEAIEAVAFFDCKRLKSINIPDSVQTIGGVAFYNCESLEYVNIPNGVKTIEGNAFSNCKRLKSITIPNSVETIEEEAFYHCESLKSITIPDSVKIIGEIAFASCINLRKIIIGKGVSEIVISAFSECHNLTDVTLSKTKISKWDFSNPDQITQEELDNFKGFVQFPKYCNIKVGGEIIEPDSNEKIKFCKDILANRYYGDRNTDQLKTFVRAQLVFSYNKIGNRKQASSELKTLKESETKYLTDYPELKRQCVQICNQDKIVAICSNATVIKQKAKAVRQTQNALYEVQKASFNGIQNIPPKDRQM